MRDNQNKQQIYINGRFLTQAVTGVQRYARELVRSLDNLLEAGEIDESRYNFKLLAPRWGIQDKLKLKNIPLRRVGRFTGHAWEQLELPLYSKGGLLFCLGNTAPVISLFSAQPTVVTIHSLAFLLFPEAYSTAFKAFYKQLVPLALRKGDAVITVSRSEKNVIISRYGSVQKRLYAIQNGAMDEDFLKSLKHTVETAPDIKQPFVLFIGSLSKGKNLGGVLQALTLLNKDHDVNLVVVGAAGKNFHSDEFNLPLEISDKVIFKGQVDTTGELVSLYKASLCLVFPSFYESSGLPPLEAMACGCPVVVSKIPSLHERCGDAALYCNPANPADIAAKIKLIISDPRLRETLRSKGLERAKRFTWQKCARETFAVIKGVLPDG
ncbi:MAG: glycosyltransferase family 1 protein [Thermincola sp.]|jgi:glycosyltransferase involved in cell wall biosynthesis|nr:glycosyltransferase family 1 protein [Thermincola sp.]MDT3703440.1 glycosyltransferase family 1 protein [Thermincola sp.]